MKTPTRTIFILACSSLLAVAVACGGDSAERGGEVTPPEESTAPPAPPPADAGRVSGTISYDGEDPDTEIDFAADPMCADMHDETIETQQVVTDGAGHLANVFVYVTSGLEAESHPAPTEPMVISQKGCVYRPHVAAAMVGQTVLIRNDDPTLHNVHAAPETNRAFNQGQPFQGMELERSFAERELMIPLKCDVHPWMQAWISVVEHPYFTVSAEDGGFAIEDLPPGDYTLEAVHETLGTRTVQVTVPPNGETETELDFSPASS